MPSSEMGTEVWGVWVDVDFGCGWRPSGLPAGTHSPLTYFSVTVRWDKVQKGEYMALGSSPVMLIFRTGNIKSLKKKAEIEPQERILEC